MYASYVTALYQAAAASLDPALESFETTFAPVPAPYDDTWLQILLSCISLVGTVAVSGYFNSGTALFLPLPVLTCALAVPSSPSADVQPQS